MQRTSLFKAVNSAARKMTYCPYCGATNGPVKKVGALRIIHDKFRDKKTWDEKEQWKKTFARGGETQKDLDVFLNKPVAEELNPLKVHELLKRITDEDCELLGLKPEFGRPEHLVWYYISVPPICIRPSVAQDGASNEDDLTVKLTEIVMANHFIKLSVMKGHTTNQLMVCFITFPIAPFMIYILCTYVGTLGLPSALYCYVCQLGAAWHAPNGSKANSWFRPAIEGQAGPFPWKSFWKAC
jgi:DNA-directed RNA polymerase III subunit RPC1